MNPANGAYWPVMKSDPRKTTEFLWEESLDSLWYALVLYLGVFTRILNDRFQPETLVVQRLRRLAAKILRYCGSPLKSDPPGNTRLQILKGVLIALEKAVAGVRVSDPASSPKPLAQPGCTFSSDTFLLDESVNDSLTVSNRDCFLILVSGPGKDFDSESLKPCLAELKVKLDLQVTILTMRTWGFILRYVTPAKYSELAQERRVLMGRDPFRQISTPPRASYVRHLVHQISQVLNYRFDLAHRLTGSGFQIAVIRALSTMLYLEHRQVVPNYTQRLRRIEAHYPEDFRRFQELLARVRFELNERNHYDCFVFFRGMAEKVRQAFSTWEPAKIEKCASVK